MCRCGFAFHWFRFGFRCSGFCQRYLPGAEDPVKRLLEGQSLTALLTDVTVVWLHTSSLFPVGTAVSEPFLLKKKPFEERSWLNGFRKRWERPHEGHYG